MINGQDIFLVFHLSAEIALVSQSFLQFNPFIEMNVVRPTFSFQATSLFSVPICALNARSELDFEILFRIESRIPKDFTILNFTFPVYSTLAALCGAVDLELMILERRKKYFRTDFASLLFPIFSCPLFEPSALLDINAISVFHFPFLLRTPFRAVKTSNRDKDLTADRTCFHQELINHYRHWNPPSLFGACYSAVWRGVTSSDDSLTVVVPVRSDYCIAFRRLLA